MNYTLDVNKPAASTIAFTNARKPFPIWASAYETRTRRPVALRFRGGIGAAHRRPGHLHFELHLGQQHQQLRRHDRPLQRDGQVDQGRERPPQLLHRERDRAGAAGQGTAFRRHDHTPGEPPDQRLEDRDHRHVRFRPILLAVVHRTRSGERQPGLRHPVAGLRGQPELRRADPFRSGSTRRPSPSLLPAPAVTAPAA